MKNVAFHNLGCKVNSYELEFVQQRFKENDFRIVPFDQKADIYIINTCTVTNIADRKSRQMLHRARTLNEDAIVVCMGCYAQTAKKEAVSDEKIDLIIGNNDKGHAFELICEYMEKKTQKEEPPDISNVTEYDEYTLTGTSEHTRVHVKIQDGCNQFCSYCAIPLARGRVRSRKIENIVNEIEDLTKKGYKEFVLTGIHLSSYGIKNPVKNSQSDYKDLAVENTDTELIDVVEAVAGIDGVKRIRIGSLEPRIITGEFLLRLRNTKKVCPHFHLSLQSGSDSVLKRMNRHYTCDEFYEKAKTIRDFFVHPAITTDVIAGFPGETEDEFLETKNFLNEVNFYEAHIFKYSKRKGTAAEKMPMQLTDKEKSGRSEILIKDAKKRSREFREFYIGKEVSVLFEEETKINGEKYIIGFTREYVKGALKTYDIGMLNNIYKCRVMGFINDEIMSMEPVKT